MTEPDLPGRARRIEAATARGTAAVVSRWRARHPDCEYDAIAVDSGVAFAGPDGSYLRAATALGFEGPVDAATWDHVEELAARTRAAPQVAVCPYADADMLVALAARGFVARRFKNTWQRPLHGDPSAPSLPHGVTIERVDVADAGAVERAARVLASGFEPDGPSRFGIEVMRMNVSCPNVATFVAVSDGEPLAGGCCSIVDGVVGLFSGSTVRAARRQGLQTALLLRRLDHARAAGADLAYVYASPGSPTERNAMRLGFSPAYTQLTVVRAGGAP